MVARLRAWLARQGVYATWAFLLALPRNRIQVIVDTAIQSTPNFGALSEYEQDAVIAHHVWLAATQDRYRRR